MATRRKTTRTQRLANGTTVTLPTPANDNVPEWRLQAAAIRAMRSMPEYAATSADAGPGRFTLAGDFNAARRSPQEAVKAKATGLTAGEHDIRLYFWPGVMGLIEMKAAKGRLSPEQRDRHALLDGLGFTRQTVIRASTEPDAAIQATTTVSMWLKSLPAAAEAA